MTSSKLKNVPSPNEGKESIYSRFIPREELSSFKAWNPDSLQGGERRSPTGLPPEPAVPPEQQLAQQLHAARQGGYQDGYRDGLAALESFKQTFASQVTAQIGRLVESHGQQLDALQQQLAQTVASCAVALARQVVRSELVVRPELVAAVAQEAVETMLLSAKHITVRVHPDDQPLVAHGAADVLHARGARLIGDATITRGGCRVDSDIASVDGTVGMRWQRAAASLGSQASWVEPESSAADASTPSPSADPSDERSLDEDAQ
jgi:flagellar assembly protein FliH